MTRFRCRKGQPRAANGQALVPAVGGCVIPRSEERRIDMKNMYDAADVIAVGSAQQVILGQKPIGPQDSAGTQFVQDETMNTDDSDE